MLLPADEDHLRLIPEGRILGVDYGDKRIGLALSDPFRMSAFSLTTLPNRSVQQVIGELRSIVEQHHVQAAVIGRPLHMSGTAGTMAQKAEAFVRKWGEAQPQLPLFLWDERWTTVSAEKLMHETGKSPSRNRDRIDQIAAAYLLQSFLQRLDVLKRTSA